MQQYAEAVQYYSKGLEVDPGNCVIHANRSACYLALEENEKAIGDADAAIAANPLYWKVRLFCFRAMLSMLCC